MAEFDPLTAAIGQLGSEEQESTSLVDLIQRDPSLAGLTRACMQGGQARGPVGNFVTTRSSR